MDPYRRRSNRLDADRSLAHSAGGRHRPVVCHRRAPSEDVQSRRGRPVCARSLRGALRARDHRSGCFVAPEDPPRQAVGRGTASTCMHASAESDPRVRRAAAELAPALSRAGADSVGFPRTVRARAVAADERTPGQSLARRPGRNSMRSGGSALRAATIPSGPSHRSGLLAK